MGSLTQKLALQPNGTFAPAGKSNLPPIGPIGGKSMPPPNTGGMIATPPPFIPGEGGRSLPPVTPLTPKPTPPKPMPLTLRPKVIVGPNPTPTPLPPTSTTPIYQPKPVGVKSSIPGVYLKKGGKVKSTSSASSRGDGIAQRGKTKGRFV